MDTAELNATNETALCGLYDTYTFGRFLFIVACSGVACVGVVCNTVLVLIFLHLSVERDGQLTSRLYVTCLALWDALLCLSYVLVFGMDAVALFPRVPAAFHVYFRCILLVFTLSRMVQMCIPYFIIVATFERWVMTTGHDAFLPCIAASFRCAVTLAIVATVGVLRSPMVFAFEIVTYANCTDLYGTKQVAPTALFFEPAYHILDFYVMSAVQVFMPFCLLIALNTTIVRTLSRDRRRRPLDDTAEPHTDDDLSPRSSLLDVAGRRAAANVRRASRDMRVRVREATHTMVAIVTIYLVCNTPHFILTILEQARAPILFEADGRASSALYMVFSDVVSALFMVSSVSRMAIYCKCNHEVRDHAKRLFCFDTAKRLSVSSHVSHGLDALRRDDDCPAAEVKLVSSKV